MEQLVADDKRKVALVTGAAGSMGLATAEGLLEDGYAVVMGDVDGDKLWDRMPIRCPSTSPAMRRLRPRCCAPKARWG
jgi:nucleoside-diphosphate-sugar epimerase